jgi:hypothetical protein
VNDPLNIFKDIFERTNGNPCDGCGTASECPARKHAKGLEKVAPSLCQRCRKEAETENAVAWFTKKGMTRGGALCNKCKEETKEHRTTDGKPNTEFLKRKGLL